MTKTRNEKKRKARKLLVTALSAVMILTAAQIGAPDAAYAADYGKDAGYLVSEATSLNQVTGLKKMAREEDEISLSWTEVQGASGYEISLYSEANETWIIKGRTPYNWFEAEDLASGTIYGFRVRAYAQNASGQITYGEYSKTYKTLTSPDEVDNLIVKSKTKSTVSLDWRNVPRADKYQVYRYSSTSGTWKRIATTSKSSYTVKNLKSGTSYRFKVRAYRSEFGYKYCGDFETIKVKTKTTTTTKTSSGYIGTAKAKQIALANAGVSSSAVKYINAHLDYDDGIRVYDVTFHTTNWEYDYEINAKTGRILDFDRDSVWDD